MKAKITNIQANGTYDSKFGMLYKQEYSFDDGTVLTANHKTEGSPFKPGDEIEYEIKGSNDYGQWGKVGKPDQFDGPLKNHVSKQFKDSSDAILYQVCLKEATQIVSIDGWGENVEMHDKLQLLSDIAYQLAFIGKDNIQKLKDK